MSLTALIPGRRDRKHHPDTIIRNLRRDMAKVMNRQAAADDFFAILLNDVTTTNAALYREKQLRGEAEEAAAQMRMERDALQDEIAELRKQLAPFLAAEANANRVDVPPMERDTSDPADQATQPIPVITRVIPLPEAANAGLLGPVTDPGRVRGVA